jgi:hypothetical protein
LSFRETAEERFAGLLLKVVGWELPGYIPALS